MGHGHVTPNPDGSKARCGGPAMCSKCALELAQLQRIQATGQEIADVIEEAHKAEALSPEVWEAQQQEIERLSRLSRLVGRRVAELEARLATLETPQKPPSVPQEVPVPLEEGDSASEYAGMPWEGRP